MKKFLLRSMIVTFLVGLAFSTGLIVDFGVENESRVHNEQVVENPVVTKVHDFVIGTMLVCFALSGLFGVFWWVKHFTNKHQIQKTINQVVEVNHPLRPDQMTQWRRTH